MNNRVFSYYNNRLAAYKFRMNIVLCFVYFRIKIGCFQKKNILNNTDCNLKVYHP